MSWLYFLPIRTKRMTGKSWPLEFVPAEKRSGQRWQRHAGGRRGDRRTGLCGKPTWHGGAGAPIHLRACWPCAESESEKTPVPACVSLSMISARMTAISPWARPLFADLAGAIENGRASPCAKTSRAYAYPGCAGGKPSGDEAVEDALAACQMLRGKSAGGPGAHRAGGPGLWGG